LLFIVAENQPTNQPTNDALEVRASHPPMRTLTLSNNLSFKNPMGDYTQAYHKRSKKYNIQIE
jgi:hypothetical protein